MPVEVKIDLAGAEDTTTIEVGIDDLPGEAIQDHYDNLVWRECSECQRRFLNAPDREDKLTCNDHP